ncbi:hypothetical protein DB30_05447 [Enhygromyxa salina]|uniref:Peptidase S8/S53 domain-containing protein n=1 Tax=Enhygromyxa salina TaxID=215803 RepID=A0A0C1ZWY6_9BACT|nr:hypothetical protein DB30_05447 [Enhygromyxa salina]
MAKSWVGAGAVQVTLSIAQTDPGVGFGLGGTLSTTDAHLELFRDADFNTPFVLDHARSAVITNAELTHGLSLYARGQSVGALDLQLTLDTPPRDNIAARHTKIGGQVDAHVDVLPELPVLTFVRSADQSVVTDIELAQGERCGVEVRCSQQLGAGFNVHLVYPGAEAKTRPATRSVIDTDYLYLSRVRLAKGVDGIEDPLHELCSGDPLLLPCADGAWDGQAAPPFLAVEKMTVVGLEWGNGDEQLEARLVDGSDNVICTARLTIKINEPDVGRGSYGVLANKNADDFKAADADFELIYAKSGATADTVRVGVCDTGIFDDSAGANYLQPRVVDGHFFSTDDTEDRPTAAYDTFGPILDASPSKHGTNVAAQAAWGSTRIELIDVMVQRGQTMGDMNAALTKTAFEWAGSRGAAIVNCSKVMHYNTDEAEQALTAYPNTLFLATGGNTSACFPFHYGELGGNEAVRKAFKGDCGIEGLPRVFTNTLLVGGHNTGPKHHDSRGYGPGIDVMVYSDDMTLYTPQALIEAFRLPAIEGVRRDTLLALGTKRDALNGEPPTVSGELPFTKRFLFTNLESRKDDLSLKEQQQYQELLLMKQARPNPKYVERQLYIDSKTLLESWPWPAGGLAAGRDQVIGWLKSFIKLGKSIGTLTPPEDAITGAWDVASWGAVKAAPHLIRQNTIGYWFDADVKTKSLERALAEIEGAEDGSGVASDAGVSFGLPIVANVAAKAKLIRSTLEANHLKRLLIDTSDYTRGFESECLAKGVINPLRAYFAAYDNAVVADGTDPRSAPPPVDLTIDEARRIYYYFYYMNAEGKRTYEAIKDKLKATYAAMDVDLIEAEPPIQIGEEPLSYVTKGKIKNRNWQQVVDLGQPLVHAPKHLRLLLLNQCGHVEDAKEFHSCEWKDPDWEAKNEAEHSYFGATLTKYSHVTAIASDLASWNCTIEIRDVESRRLFPSIVDHVVDRIRVGDADDSEVIDPSTYVTTWVSPTQVRVTVTDATTVGDIRTGKNVYVEVRVVQQLGGSRDEGSNNVFITNKYHAGPNGTPEANDSILVLFMHEIGHALGMVPDTHAHHYENAHGGQGHHCAFNSQDVANAVAASDYQIPGDGSTHVKVPTAIVDPSRGPNPPCVMYHTRSSVHHTSEFCAVCVQTVKDLDGATWQW